MTTRFSPPHKVIGKVQNLKSLNAMDMELTIQMVQPEEFDFLPGQFITLNCGNNSFRAYSIGSSSYDKKRVSLIVSVAHEGVGSNFIKSLKVGDSIEFIGPSGRFVLPEVLKNNLEFIATGTGVSPILSMLDYLANNKCTSNIYLHFGVRGKDDVFAVDFLNSLKSALPNFKYTLCFSHDMPEEFTECSIMGRVNDSCGKDKIDLDNTQFFLCGNPYMITDMLKILTDLGVESKDIYHEKFTVSTQPAKS